MEQNGHWRDLQMLLGRSSNLAGPNFEPGTSCLDFIQAGQQPESVVSVHKSKAWRMKLTCFRLCEYLRNFG